ncbi:MAG: twin-arginine translocation signal domain-containing protein [Tateyamaria sp.]|jgi:hypothetical protein|nr:twin-arginine translocation signal domain-containing protein [Tateyamaria sp.]
MISRDRGGRLTTSRRNFIKAGAVAGALTVNVNCHLYWPHNKLREKNPCCSI